MPTISSSTLDSLALGTQTAKEKAADTYNQFLILLTTQLQNQDPLEPTKSEEFTNQLVQFSQVEQAILGNEKLDSMLIQSGNSQIGQSLGYIGKDVYYNGNTVYNDGQPIKIGYAVDGISKSANLRITDETGAVVRTIPVPAGTTSGNLTWDGMDDFNQPLPQDATYTVNVDALDEGGNGISSFTGVPGHVTGIETVQGILYLSLKGDTRIDATTVLSVSQPDTPTV